MKMDENIVISDLVKAYAAQGGWYEIIFLGRRNGENVYLKGLKPTDKQYPMPTGLPLLMIENENGIRFVHGYEALQIWSEMTPSGRRNE